MHPRNIYKDGHPDFEALGVKYPALADYLIRDDKGRVRIDFKNKAALRALTRALLQDDFSLNVIFPEDCLVPTIPLRLNYILWIEDLLHSMYSGDTSQEIRGIDIGTGASTIYALLGARKNRWRMTGTDSNEESVRFAVNNVRRNNLDDLVEIIQVDNAAILTCVLKESNETVFDFTMCNPPFFSTVEETDSCLKAKKKDRPLPSSAKTGTLSELVVPGGEEKFIEQMVDESKLFPSKVRIFTTMIGLKKHLKSSIQELKRAQVKHYTTTEFTQGRTMRWGLAWTFDDNIKLVIPSTKPKTKTYAPLEMTFPTKLLLKNIFTNLRDLLLTKLSMMILKEDKISMEVHATTNTWSHQRRKRREQQIRSMETDVESPPEKSARIVGTEVETPPEKPRRMQEFTPEFRYRISEISPHSSTSRMISAPSENADRVDTSNSDLEPGDDLEVGLHFNVSVTREISQGKIKLEYLGGDLGREGMYQVLQYMKNRAQTDFA